MSILKSRRLLLSTLFVGLLVGVMAWFVDWRLVTFLLARASWWKLVAGLLLLVLGFVIYAFRWRLILPGKPRFLPVFHASNVGSMANMLLPLRPGDAMRIFMLDGVGHLSLLQITSSLIVERWFEQLMRLAALGGAIVLGSGLAVSHLTITGLVVFLLGSWLAVVWAIRHEAWLTQRLPGWVCRLLPLEEQRVRVGLSHILDGLESLAQPSKMLQGLLTSLSAWILFWGYHYLCLVALAPSLPMQVRLGMTLGSLALVPPSATTLPGVFQLSMVVPLALVGYDRNLLTSYSLILNLVEMLIVNGLGLWGTSQLNISLEGLLDRASSWRKAQTSQESGEH